MNLRPLGRTGLRVSPLSLGAMTFGESRTFMRGVTSHDDEARRVFDAALDAGVNLVDTANVYSEGRSEELVGAWIAGKRDRVLLAANRGNQRVQFRAVVHLAMRGGKAAFEPGGQA